MNRKISKAIEKTIRKMGLKEFVESSELNLKLFKGLSPIVIYQMGKVGSTTIYKSLIESQIPNPVFHLHFLSTEGHELCVADYKRTQPGKPLYDHIRHSQIIRSKLADKNIRWKIITLVRDPIAREISDYFQTLKRKSPESFDERGNLKNINNIIQTIEKILSNFDESSDYASTWFDKELKTVFDLDVYAHAFDKEKGYTIINSEKAEVLVIRLENLNYCSNVLTEFLDEKNPIEIINKNISSSKKYAFQYKNVKNQIVVPKAVCKNIYASKLTKHFYTDDEIAQFTNKWSERRAVKQPSDSIKYNV